MFHIFLILILIVVCIATCIASIIESATKRTRMKKLQDLSFSSFREFELACARELRDAGWTTTVSPAGPDQGVDVFAERDGFTMAIQCKFYSRPVGNKAVQEAFAAKSFTGAHAAAVVTNSIYTRSAEELAETTGVLLLHVSDLESMKGTRSHRPLDALEKAMAAGRG